MQKKAVRNRDKKIKDLIDKSEYVNSYGWNIVHIAAMSDNYEALKYLILNNSEGL